MSNNTQLIEKIKNFENADMDILNTFSAITTVYPLRVHYKKGGYRTFDCVIESNRDSIIEQIQKKTYAHKRIKNYEIMPPKVLNAKFSEYFRDYEFTTKKLIRQVQNEVCDAYEYLNRGTFENIHYDNYHCFNVIENSD